MGRPSLPNLLTNIVFILHLFPTTISVRILSPIIAIFLDSHFSSLITSRVTFFLGFKALNLYLISKSLAILLIRFSEGLLLIKYKEKNFLDSNIQSFTALGILLDFLFIRVPSTSINKLSIPYFCSFERVISYIGNLESQ